MVLCAAGLQVVTPAQIKDLYPLLNVDDVVGGLFSPGDGTVEPSGVVAASTRMALLSPTEAFLFETH